MLSVAARQRRREKRAVKSVEATRVVAELSMEGRFCANCRHIGSAPFPGKGRICELGSDSDGYMPVLPTGLCAKHEFRANRDTEDGEVK